MTPQTQAEQKARELRKSLQFKDHPFNAHARQIGDVAEQELTLLIQKADENDSIVKALPPTFYADLPLYKRVEFMWEQWNRAIKCLQELEIKNDALIQKADALDWVIGGNGYGIVKSPIKHNELPQWLHSLSAINQARKEQG